MLVIALTDRMLGDAILVSDETSYERVVRHEVDRAVAIGDGGTAPQGATLPRDPPGVCAQFDWR